MWGKCEPIEQAGLFVSLARLIFFFFFFCVDCKMGDANSTFCVL